MANYSSPYASDPFYENLRARARRRRAEEARGPTTNIVDTGVDTSGSDGPNVDVVGTNLHLRSHLPRQLRLLQHG